MNEMNFLDTLKLEVNKTIDVYISEIESKSTTTIDLFRREVSRGFSAVFAKSEEILAGYKLKVSEVKDIPNSFTFSYMSESDVITLQYYSELATLLESYHKKAKEIFDHRFPKQG